MLDIIFKTRFYLFNLRKKIIFRFKRKFTEYGYKIKSYDIKGDGIIQYAQWLNPFEGPREFTHDQIFFYKCLIKKGELAIDIGAHSGDTTIPMAIATGKAGLVLAFDPNPYVFKILKVNSTLNVEKTNIIPYNYAITDIDGDFFYNSSEATFNNGGISKVKSENHGHFELNQKIKGINLLNFLNQHYKNSLNNLSFIKIDTEGYDKEIIKSISNLIMEYRPFIIFECFIKLTKKERIELFNLIYDKTYSLYYIEDFIRGSQIIYLNQNDMMNWKHFDILATPKEKEKSLIEKLIG